MKPFLRATKAIHRPQRTENSPCLVQRLVYAERIPPGVFGGDSRQPCVSWRTAEALAQALDDTEATQGNHRTGDQKDDFGDRREPISDESKGLASAGLVRPPTGYIIQR